MKINNNCAIYRTYDKSNLNFLPESNILFTDQLDNIDLKHGLENDIEIKLNSMIINESLHKFQEL